MHAYQQFGYSRNRAHNPDARHSLRDETLNHTPLKLIILT
jgi:hypothetical protein